LAEKLAALGINSIKDLWFHFPLRYQDRTRITPIGSLHEGLDAVIEGEIRIASIAMGRRRSLMVKLQDGTGTLTLRFFHFSRAQQQQLQTGIKLRCFGTVRRGGHTFEMVHPEYRQIQCDAVVPVDDALTPIYPTTAGIGQTTWRKLCSAALQILEQNEPLELLPPSLSNRIDMVAAIRLLHQPPPDISLKALAEKNTPHKSA
jgi:ATP-dependent DNA helicase RecG (EC 3.6.1.-)